MRIPENAQINIASEIILNPIVSHHIMKNGFKPVSAIPTIMGFFFDSEKIDLFFIKGLN